MNPLPWLRRRAPELYFFFYNASIVFLLPWLTILWKANGLSGSQIGIMSCIRPFTSAISGQLLVGLADAKRWHLSITVVTYCIALAARSSMSLAHGFAAQLLLVLASEATQPAFSIMSDAAIAASTDAAGYGRKRVLASIGWGAPAPLAGWIVGKWGGPHAIAVYFALVMMALVPTTLLPIKELGRKRGASAEQEAEAAAFPSAEGKAPLDRTSALPLLPGGAGSAGDGHLDSRQHNGHAAELAIELFETAGPSAGADSAAGKAAEAAGGDTEEAALVERISSKLAQAEAAAAGITLRPLLTTADEDAASEAAAAASPASTAAAPAASPAPGIQEQEEGDSWSIAAVGSPVAAQRASLPPITCPQPLTARPGGMLGTPRPGGTPGSAAAMFGSTPPSARPGTSALARTTSQATTAFYSVVSARSTGASGCTAGMLSPRGLSQTAPRSLLRQISDAASLPASTPGAPLATPRRAVRAGGGGLLRQASNLSQAVGGGLLHQVSNLSQALNGFDQSFLEGSVSDGTLLSPRIPSFAVPPPLAEDGALPAFALQAAAGSPRPAELEAVKAGLLGLPAVHTVHPPHFLEQAPAAVQQQASRRSGRSGQGGPSGGQPRRRTSSRASSLRLLPEPLGMETVRSSLLASLIAPSGTAAGMAARQGIKAPLLPLASQAGSSSSGGGGKDVEEAGLPELAISMGAGQLSSHGGSLAAGEAEGGADEAGEGGSAAAREAGYDLSVWGGIKQMLSNPHHAAFFATTFLMGVGYGVLGYETLYLKESGAPGILIGLCVVVNSVGEATAFATSGRWLPKLGEIRAFQIGMFGWVLRLALYTLLPLFPSLWVVLPVELLQSLTFAVSYGIGTIHAKAIAPVHLRSTVQSLFFSLYYGVGPGISGLAGGYIYESMGMRFVFVIGSCTLLAGWAVIQLALWLATRKERAERAAAAEVAPF